MSNTALRRVQKIFPQVKKVRDAKQNISITVEAQDNTKGRKKDPRECALAQACKRQHLADGAIVGVSYTWLINNDIATRYLTSGSIGREITSFDRHQHFEPGNNYLLSKPTPSNRLGSTAGRKRSKGTGNGPKMPKRTVHRTTNIRTIK